MKVTIAEDNFNGVFDQNYVAWDGEVSGVVDKAVLLIEACDDHLLTTDIVDRIEDSELNLKHKVVFGSGLVLWLDMQIVDALFSDIMCRLVSPWKLQSAWKGLTLAMINLIRVHEENMAVRAGVIFGDVIDERRSALFGWERFNKLFTGGMSCNGCMHSSGLGLSHCGNCAVRGSQAMFCKFVSAVTNYDVLDTTEDISGSGFDFKLINKVEKIVTCDDRERDRDLNVVDWDDVSSFGWKDNKVMASLSVEGKVALIYTLKSLIK